MLKRRFTSLLLLACLLPACSTSFITEPNLTQMPSPTVTPTQTPISPIATLLPAPTATPEIISTLVVVDGFTISVPFFLRHQVNGNIMQIKDDKNILNVSFAVDPYDDPELVDVIDTYLASLEKRGWQFTKGEQSEIQVDGMSGLTMDLAGSAGELSFEGQAVAVSPKSDFVMFGLGISRTNDDQDTWKNNGKVTFEGLIQTIQFTDTNATCLISSDNTYGYSDANPIKVGGDAFSGPSRERAYLDNLRGPNGEELSYEREGSLPSGDTILDAYHVTGSGIDVVLYVDVYNFSELQAPIGFTCNGAFPLSAP
jgi:hypothetical protein